MVQLPVKLDEYINTNKILNTEDYENIPFDSFENNQEFNPDTFSISDLCLVHTTDYFPENGSIKSPYDKEVTVDNKGYRRRKTMHFCLNGRVTSHANGNFDGKAFVVIDPLEKHINDMYSILPQDSYTSKKFDLSNKSIILVDYEKRDKLKNINTEDYNIIFYTGSQIKAVELVVQAMGFKPKKIEMHDWVSYSHFSPDTDILKNYIKKNYPKIENSVHCGSYYYSFEKAIESRDYKLSEINSKIIDTRKGYILGEDELLSLLRRCYPDEDFTNYSDYMIESLSKILATNGISYNPETQQFILKSDDEVLEDYKTGIVKTAAEKEIYQLMSKKIIELFNKKALEEQKLEQERQKLEQERQKLEQERQMKKNFIENNKNKKISEIYEHSLFREVINAVLHKDRYWEEDGKIYIYFDLELDENSFNLLDSTLLNGSEFVYDSHDWWGIKMDINKVDCTLEKFIKKIVELENYVEEQVASINTARKK